MAPNLDWCESMGPLMQIWQEPAFQSMGILFISNHQDRHTTHPIPVYKNNFTGTYLANESYMC